MNDKILRISAANGAVRAFFADTTQTVRAANEIHQLSPVAAAALGRTLTITAILSKMLKSKKDTVTVQIDGGGPIGRITAISGTDVGVRGYVDNPTVESTMKSENKLDVGKAVGKNGKLIVIKDLGMKRPYVGSVEMQTGEIAEDFVYYFAKSEQTPTVLTLGVLINTDLSIKRAGGFLIELLPEASDETIIYFEELLMNLKSFTSMLEETNSLEAILGQILSDLSYKITEESPVEYECNCSRPRMKKNLLALGEKELMDIISEEEDIEVECHFCHTKYSFSTETIAKELKKKHEGDTLGE